MRDAELRRRFSFAVELLDRCGSVWAERVAAMTDAQHGWPASPNLDPTTTRGGGHWCWDHERDVSACHAASLGCSGEMVGEVPDPVGEAAYRRDRAYDDRESLERSVRSLVVEAERLAGILGRYGKRKATDAERRLTLREGERPASADECWSCARGRNSAGAPIFAPGSRRVTLADGESRLLCEWCRSWVREVGALPSVRQVEDHDRGVRIRRPKAS